jgi:hypothetical protein
MPESRHRRKGKQRPRPSKAAGPTKNPPPSPAWVPITGSVLLGLGVLVILAGYFTAISGPILGQNFPLVLGFVLLAIGFGFLTQWR